MPKFLSRKEVYRLLQRENPEDVYPDGAPSAYYSTAEMDAVASGLADAYENLRLIYENNFPISATGRISDWEITAFGKRLPASLTLSERQDRVEQKVRARKGLTVSDMKDIVKSVIGTDKLVEIAEWGCETGTWLIGVSELGITTILNGYRLNDATGEGLCDASPADYGYSDDDWETMREEAYTYEVLIYDHTLTAYEENEIDEQLTIYEPARCQHIITDGLDSDDMIEATT